MIAERMERQLNHLATLLKRDNEDFRELAPIALDNLRREVDVLRSMEEQAFVEWMKNRMYAENPNLRVNLAGLSAEPLTGGTENAAR